MATLIPPPPFGTPFLAGGQVGKAWVFWIAAVHDALYGGGVDRIDAAHALASAAAPRTTQIVAGGGLQAGGALTGNVGVSLYRAKAAVAQLPAVGMAEGDWAYALDGRKPGEAVGSGSGVACFWSGGAWIAATSGAAVTA